MQGFPESPVTSESETTNSLVPRFGRVYIGSMAQKKNWFAASNEILRMGPFPSEVKAWEAMRSSDKGEFAPVHVLGVRVWPEAKCHG